MIIRRVGQFSKVAVCAVALTLGACVATFQSHGYVPEQDALDELVVGVDTRGSLEDLVGPPSSTGVMADEGWFYISSKIRHYAYTRPQVIERQLVAVTFDDEDTIVNIQRFGLEDGNVITLNRRVTELPVKGPSVLGQILGTFGNIDLGQALADN